MLTVLFVSFAAVFVGSLHPASGSTTTPVDSTTSFESRPEVQELFQFYGNSEIVKCIDQTTKDVCTKQDPSLTGQINREKLCRQLKVYSLCIDKCSQSLRDRTTKALEDFSCGGCGFLQGSLLVVMLLALLHYFV